MGFEGDEGARGGELRRDGRSCNSVVHPKLVLKGDKGTNHTLEKMRDEDLAACCSFDLGSLQNGHVTNRPDSPVP